MKNHSNRILTVFFAVSLAISISLFFVRAAAFPFEIYGAIEICAFYFPAVPFLFLQMLLCKAVQKKWVRFLPLLAVAIVAMVAAVGCATASGWDTLGYLILLKLKEVDLNKTRLEREIDSLPADAKYRERKLHDMTLRLDSLYDVIVELEEKIEDARLRRDAIKQQAITLENIYKIMVNFDCVYNIINDEEKRNVVTALIKEIDIYKSFFLEVLKLLAFQGIWMFLCSQFPLFFPLPGKNKGKSYCTLSSSFAASRLASLLACA